VLGELETLGARSRVVRRPRDPAEGVPLLVVAPHEVLPALHAEAREQFEWIVAQSLLLVLAHPGSPEWQATLPYAEHAGALLHVSDAGVAAFKRLGRRVRRFPLGHHASFEAAGPPPPVRDVDVAFVGVTSPRRLRVLAEAASVLAASTTEILLPDTSATSSGPVLDYLGAEERNALYARSSLVLDVQREDDHAFGWLRVVQAICNGAVVLAEDSDDHLPLQPGRHFLQVSDGDLGASVESALADPVRLDDLRAEAVQFLRTELPLATGVAGLADLADDLHSGRRRRRQPAPIPQVEQAPVARESDPRIDELTAMVAKQSAVLKKLFVDLRLLRRQLARMQHTIESPDEAVVEVTRSAAAQGGAPEVSVLVSVHNYERFVLDALTSALASADVDVELVIVDDASTDTSVATIKGFMEERSDAAITLVEQRINTGVQRARNHAFGHVRAPYVFVLDADNLVYPRGIGKLVRALEADPRAGYAYGLLERFSGDRSIDLMNTHSWDAARLAEEHYIDAMALIRTDAWRSVGGYVTEQALELGWEDYDLWLSFAMAGMHGAYVREIVGRYRIHGVSSLTTTTLDTELLRRRLQERHAPFFAAASRTS
jgi:GT2 family glycosyltransferase